MFFLLDSAGAPAVPYEPCMTGVMVVHGRALRAESANLYHGGIRGQESYLGFPIHEAGSGMLQQEKQGSSLLRKLNYN